MEPQLTMDCSVRIRNERSYIVSKYNVLQLIKFQEMLQRAEPLLVRAVPAPHE